MNKRERYIADLRHLTPDGNELMAYLIIHSNLPGKRGNLELAFAFAEFMEEQYSIHPERAMIFCERLITENPHGKQITGSEEFLPFCGVLGLGRIGKIDQISETVVVGYVKSAAQDERWRIREAAAMAIQDLMELRPEATMALLVSWTHEDSFLLHRAVAAGIAEPHFMKKREYACIALELHKTLLKNVANETNSNDPKFLVLVKGLCYTLSVVIVGIEKDGFSYLESLIAMDHPVIHKIVRENLKKKRLLRLNAEIVAKLQKKLLRIE